jgi:hypothetical protein
MVIAINSSGLLISQFRVLTYDDIRNVNVALYSGITPVMLELNG